MSGENSVRKHPRVSIGMPVYNGGALLAPAIDSLIAQDFTDFELIISDNASTDMTEAVCRDYAARDPRITYIRRDKNYGASNNGNTVLKQSTGDYFMYAAHDDRWHPQFISECMKILDNNPKVVLATSAIQFLSADDGSFCETSYPPLHTVGQGLRGSAAAIFNETNVGYNFYGLYRKNVLTKINLDIDCYGSDVVILLQMVLLGEVAYIPRKLFYYRLSRKTAKDQMDSVRIPGNDNSTTKPYTLLTINLFRAIVNSGIDPALKRIILGDALEIIAAKNMEWRNAILFENQTLVPFIDPGKNGFSSTLTNNVIALFAGLLLPYYVTAGPVGGAVDFSDIASFDTIPDEHRKPPAPDRKEFMETLTHLAEKSKTAEMLAYYDRYRSSLPDTENLVHIDSMIQRCRQ